MLQMYVYIIYIYVFSYVYGSVYICPHILESTWKYFNLQKIQCKITVKLATISFRSQYALSAFRGPFY